MPLLVLLARVLALGSDTILAARLAANRTALLSNALVRISASWCVTLGVTIPYNPAILTANSLESTVPRWLLRRRCYRHVARFCCRILTPLPLVFARYVCLHDVHYVGISAVILSSTT